MEKSESTLITKTLLSISNDIAATRTKEDLVMVLLDKLNRLVPFDDILITIFDSQKNTHYDWAYHYQQERRDHPNFEDFINADHPVEDGILDVIMSQKEPSIFVIEELLSRTEIPDYVYAYKATGIEELVGVIMRNGEVEIGGLFLTSERKDNFKKKHLEIIKGISSQLCIAAANILANEEIQRHEREKSMLLNLSNSIVCAKDRKELSIIVRNEYREMAPMDDLLVSFYNYRQDFHFTYNPFSVQDEQEISIINVDDLFGALINNKIIHSYKAESFEVPCTLKAGQPGYLSYYREREYKSFVAIAMRDGDEFLGCVYVARKKIKKLSQETLTFLLGLSKQLSLAIKNIIANGELSEKDREKSILLKISNDIATIRDRDNFSSMLKKHLSKLFYFSHALTAVVHEGKGTYSGFVFDPASKTKYREPEYARISSSTYPLDNPAIKTVVHSKKPVIFDLDEMVNRVELPEWIEMNYRAGILEILIAPLINGDSLIGFFVLFTDRKKQILEPEISLIQGICYQLSVAVANIIANEQILERENEKSTLLTLSNHIAVIRNKADLHKIIKEKLQKILPISHIITLNVSLDGLWYSAFSLDPESRTINHPEYNTIVNSTYPIEEGILASALKSESPMVVDLEQVVKDPSAPRFLIMNYDCGILSAVLSPLTDGEHKTGILVILLRQKNDLTSNYLSLIKGITDQLSTAIANITANEKIEKQLQEIESYKRQLEIENMYLQEEIQTTHNYSELIGTSEPMKNIFQLISKVSDSSSSVLLLGETGTGKELIARAIHNSSPRKDKVMIKVNCATLPANLIESELFGHERGSFTGATEKRIGKFELANKSTLFLDEIGELSLELQVKLLRVLQEKEIERVGGKSVIKTDVRIIAATNRNLQKEVLKGTFRSDLFFRLNVFPIMVPPLRDRKEDIPILASHFLIKHAGKGKIDPMRFSNSAMRDLISYNWPGNVRELEHLIERSVLLSTGNMISDVHLPISETSGEYFPQGAIKTIDQIEREHIINVLKKTNGKISGKDGAAALLKIPPTTLSSKMQKLKISKGLITAAETNMEL